MEEYVKNGENDILLDTALQAYQQGDVDSLSHNPVPTVVFQICDKLKALINNSSIYSLTKKRRNTSISATHDLHHLRPSAKKARHDQQTEESVQQAPQDGTVDSGGKTMGELYVTSASDSSDDEQHDTAASFRYGSYPQTGKASSAYDSDEEMDDGSWSESEPESESESEEMDISEDESGAKREMPTKKMGALVARHSSIFSASSTPQPSQPLTAEEAEDHKNDIAASKLLCSLRS